MVYSTVADTRVPINQAAKRRQTNGLARLGASRTLVKGPRDSPPREPKYILVFRNEGLGKVRKTLVVGLPYPGQQGIHWFPADFDTDAKNTRSPLMRSETSRDHGRGFRGSRPTLFDAERSLHNASMRNVVPMLEYPSLLYLVRFGEDHDRGVAAR